MNAKLLGLILAAMSLQADDELLTVSVCLNYQSAQIPSAFRAKYVASRIYEQIGVEIEWSSCNKVRQPDVRVQFVPKAPSSVEAGVIAFALPYEGKTVEIFVDRVIARTQNYGGDLLGHVLAHEIAHLLQGFSRHSDSGVMKPRWTESEKGAMSYRPLELTQYDARLIRAGIAARRKASTGAVVSAFR